MDFPCVTTTQAVAEEIMRFGTYDPSHCTKTTTKKLDEIADVFARHKVPILSLPTRFSSLGTFPYDSRCGIGGCLEFELVNNDSPNGNYSYLIKDYHRQGMSF